MHVLWGVLLLTAALRHPTTEACLAELRRNAGSRRLIGIDSEDAAPKKWNVSRFQDVLGQEPHRSHLQAIFNTIVEGLASVVPDLGKNTADDGNVRGSRRFFAQVGVVMVVHAAFASLLAAAPRYEGRLGKLSLSPIAKALRTKLAASTSLPA